MNSRGSLKLRALMIGVGVALAGVAGWVVFAPHGALFGRLTRGAALAGYLFIFLSILSSAYTRQLSRLFGQPFIRVHHTLAVTGLTLATLHPLAFALDAGTLDVLIPKLGSWGGFIQRAGCPGWGMLVTATAAALLRKPIGKHWRMIHGLNYLAFLFITVHAMLLGSDTQTLLARVAGGILALLALGAAVRRVGRT